VVVTPAQWDDYIGTTYGGGHPAVTSIKEQVLRTPDGVRYLVYDGSYDWTPSETREPPTEDFDPGPGHWVVTDDDGNVIDRFADWNGPA
jgi:hypothetical protein